MSNLILTAPVVTILPKKSDQTLGWSPSIFDYKYLDELRQDRLSGLEQLIERNKRFILQKSSKVEIRIKLELIFSYLVNHTYIKSYALQTRDSQLEIRLTLNNNISGTLFVPISDEMQLELPL